MRGSETKPHRVTFDLGGDTSFPSDSRRLASHRMDTPVKGYPEYSPVLGKWPSPSSLSTSNVNSTPSNAKSPYGTITPRRPVGAEGNTVSYNAQGAAPSSARQQYQGATARAGHTPYNPRRANSSNITPGSRINSNTDRSGGSDDFDASFSTNGQQQGDALGGAPYCVAPSSGFRPPVHSLLESDDEDGGDGLTPSDGRSPLSHTTPLPGLRANNYRLNLSTSRMDMEPLSPNVTPPNTSFSRYSNSQTSQTPTPMRTTPEAVTSSPGLMSANTSAAMSVDASPGYSSSCNTTINLNSTLNTSVVSKSASLAGNISTSMMGQMNNSMVTDVGVGGEHDDEQRALQQHGYLSLYQLPGHSLAGSGPSGSNQDSSSIVTEDYQDANWVLVTGLPATHTHPAGHSSVLALLQLQFKAWSQIVDIVAAHGSSIAFIKFSSLLDRDHALSEVGTHGYVCNGNGQRPDDQCVTLWKLVHSSDLDALLPSSSSSTHYEHATFLTAIPLSSELRQDLNIRIVDNRPCLSLAGPALPMLDQQRESQNLYNGTVRRRATSEKWEGVETALSPGGASGSPIGAVKHSRISKRKDICSLLAEFFFTF